MLAWLAENPGASVAQAREAAQTILAACAEDGCRDAAALAAAWYDAQGKAAGAALDRAVTSATVDRDSLDRTVHYQAAKLSGGDGAGFAAAVGEWVENEAKASLNATIMANVGRDRRKGVKFARVTSGATSCGFCLMLASRGAVYRTRQTAGELGRYHRHCDCKIVPSFSGDQYEVLVEGHDPKKIGDRLGEVVRQSGEAMGSAGFLREVALRDPDWLLGEAAEFSAEPGARPNPREIQTAIWLQARGIKCVFRKTREDEAKPTSDVFINGAPWEFKQPMGSGKNNVYNQFNEAARQSDRLVIDCSRSPFGFEEVCERAAAALARRDDFAEVIVVDAAEYKHLRK